MRDVVRGVAAAVAALLATAFVAASAVLLLGADRFGSPVRLTAAVVALAVGGTAELDAAPAGGLPVTVHGVVDVMPLGVSLVGVVVLGALLLRRGRDGLPVRAAAAAAVFPAGLAALAFAARGNLTLRLPEGTSGAALGCVRGPSLPFRAVPSSLSAAFSVEVAPTAAAGAIWVLVVAGVCWAALRFRAFAAGLRGTLIAVGALTAVCLLAAATFGGAAAAGGVLLVLPQVVSAVLVLGLGVPMTLPCGAGPSLTWVSAIVLLGCGVVVAARTRHRPGRPLRRAAVIAVRLASAVGAVLAVMALLSRVSLELSIAVFSFPIPVVGANPLLALAAGLAGGALAGFAGSLLVDGFRSRFSVSSRAWKR
ncbi:streptophobe family protein [Amycolatopsis sp. NPDC051128]|uniref:streptophobe family protein n=1 Tax=Amycolatopsis sp. NPDC051128 TaxID=3155412 RepID=UPI0034376A0C